MSTTENEFERLMERIRRGEAEAARELFERYGKAIQIVVRRRLHQRLRSQFDSLDFAQEAWASFFHLAPERPVFKTPEQLMAFLTGIVRHKLSDAYRQRFPSDDGEEGKGEDSAADLENQPARQPTPSRFAIVKEEWERILHDKPPKVRQALEMLRQGYSRQEIAHSLGVNPKLIQRVLQTLDDSLRSK